MHELKGLSEHWELFTVIEEDVAGPAIPDDPSPLRPTDRLALAAARRAPRILRAINRISTARSRAAVSRD
jgi:hypothetical protein